MIEMRFCVYCILYLKLQNYIINQQSNKQDRDMRSCFSCVRRLRFLFRSKNNLKKWLNYVQSYCSQNTKFQWCQLIIQNFEELRKYTNASEQTLRQLRSTNISSEIIKVMRRQYELKQTPFNLLVDIFTTYAKNKYTNIGNINHLTLNKLTSDTQNFIAFMRSLMVIFYTLEQRQLIGDDQFFRVTLSNFITQCIFSSEQYYNCVIQVTKISCKQAQDRICFNMQKFLNIGIDQYEINNRYTLNAQTLEKLDGKVGNKIIQKPYLGAIKIVKQIIKSRTPLQKTKCIQNLISQIQFSIRKFYQDNQIQQQISLDADNAIAILIYILVQSEQSQLLIHLNIIYHFLNKQLLEGKLRFCLDMIKACLQFLEKGTIKKSKGYNVEEGQFSLWINTKSYFEYIGNK